MDFQDITYTKEKGIAIITLNRPHIMNAVSQRMITEWQRALFDAQEDSEVKAVIVTGGGRTFCSGGNPRELLAFRHSVAEARKRAMTSDRLLVIVDAVARLEKPYIAAVNGPAVGAGMDLATMCDIRIASERARFSMAYVRMGEVPVGGGCYFLPRIVGIARACELIWTGKMIDAQEALRIGYVSRVVPPEELMPAALELATQIAKGPAVAIQQAKKLIYRCWELDLDAACTALRASELIALVTEDAKEGPRAWVEKREPVFKGK